ncbi:inositol polyphosphate 5-phosphatase [Ceratobasidium sp. AG-Ba]|nr:inositol polyphosphate 5-phosphatase [Ceratobasidium sp. AG-Ba]
MADLHQLPSHSPWISEPLPPLSPAWAGQSGNQDLDIHVLRQRWLAEELTKQDAELKHMRNLSIRIGTFNVNGQQPMEPLRTWVCNPESSDPPADLIVLGFQELDLSTEALLISSTTLREDMWCEAVMRDLAELRDQYVKLTSKQLVGILIVVLIRKPVLQLLAPSGVASSSAGVGILGTMGNKGGVALRLQIMDTVLVFVNAHLAASAQPVPPSTDAEGTKAPGPRFVGRGAPPSDPVVERRNADYHSLTGPSGRLNFSLLPSTPSALPTTVGLWDCHAIFFMGGMIFYFNYRVDLLDDEIRAVLDETTDRDYSALLSFDQLKVQQYLGKAFSTMREGSIAFAPTYRCEIGKKEGHFWDSKRRPAWTDRILWQTARGKGGSVRIVEGSYKSHPIISLSDHKPVSADFIVDVEELDREMAADRLKLLVKNLGRLPLEEDVPRVKFSHDIIDWGFVKHLKPQELDLSFQNVGITTVYWRIIPTQANGPLYPEWMKVEPTSGVLLPGNSVIIHIATQITNEIASHLNTGAKTLEDIIILHTIRGKDTFIPVTGTWTPTCLAYTPDALVRLAHSVRDSAGSRNTQLSTEKALSSPRELMRLINWLMKYSIECDELFVKPGDPLVIDAVIEALDTGNDFPFSPVSPAQDEILAIGSALLLFLEEMPEPVIPLRLHPHCGLTSFLLFTDFGPPSQPQCKHVDIYHRLSSFLLPTGLTEGESLLTVPPSKNICRDLMEGFYGSSVGQPIVTVD